jgi:superfamily II DNA helicase RecQ
MSLQYKFFSIPIPYGQDVEDGMNAFLRSIRLVHVHREIVCQDNRHYWAVSVEYLTGTAGEPRRSEAAKRKIDYKEELSPENFAVFAKLREWRKTAATREAVQLYAVFMNEQLAAMVERRVTTKSELMAIDGVGEARSSKYGDEVLAILRESFANTGSGQCETDRESVPEDSLS